VPVRGERLIRARLLGEKDREIVPPAYHTVVFDDHVPERVTFVELPKQVKRDLTMKVMATGWDKGAGIKEVVFFVGPPTEDGKLPALKAPGQLVEGKDDLWEARLPLPGDKKGELEVGVRFTNRVGLSAFAKGTVELVEFDPVKNAPGVIQGVVVEGGLPQPGLVVTLLDAKGAKLSETKTNSEGSYRFEGLAPGAYYLSVVKPSNQRRAMRGVNLLPGQTERVRLELFL
jgi:hypothetical protein